MKNGCIAFMSSELSGLRHRACKGGRRKKKEKNQRQQARIFWNDGSESERGQNIIAAVPSLALVRFSSEGKGRFQNDNKLHLQEMTS